MNIRKLKPKQDNVLVRLALHERAREDAVTEGGIIIPRARNAPQANESVEATVIAAGPGHYPDKWIDHEQGTAPVGVTRFIPMDPAIRKGARVLIENASVGDCVFSDERDEYRMIRERNVVAVAE